MPVVYCHSCQAQFSVPQNEGACPNCGGGFVEEVAQAHPAATGPASGSGTYSRTYTLPGGIGNVRIVTSTGGGLPPGFAGGFGGPGMGDPFVNSVLETLLGGGFLHPGAGGGPFAGMPMPAMGGGLAQEQEWLDQVMSQIMNEYQPPSQAASQRAVRSLPKLTVRAKDAVGEPGKGEALARAGEPCSVCHDEYREGEEVLELPCGHNYHSDCLMPWLETHNTCPVCRHELPAEDPQVEAERRRRAQQAPSGASSSRRQRQGEQQGGGRLADLLAGISSRWESFRDSMARPDEPAGGDQAGQAAAERPGASAGAGRAAAQAQQAGAHAQQSAARAHAGAAAAGSSGRFATAGSAERGGAPANSAAGAAASTRPAAGSSADGLRQRRESAAAAAERRLRGDSATSLPSQPTAPPAPAPTRTPPPASAARPAVPPHPAASRVQPPPPAAEEEEREEGGDGVVAGALLGGALGAVLGGALMLLGRRGQRDRN